MQSFFAQNSSDSTPRQKLKMLSKNDAFLNILSARLQNSRIRVMIIISDQTLKKQGNLP